MPRAGIPHLHAALATTRIDKRKIKCSLDVGIFSDSNYTYFLLGEYTTFYVKNINYYLRTQFNGKQKLRDRRKKKLFLTAFYIFVNLQSILLRKYKFSVWIFLGNSLILAFFSRKTPLLQPEMFSFIRPITATEMWTKKLFSQKKLATKVMGASVSDEMPPLDKQKSRKKMPPLDKQKSRKNPKALLPLNEPTTSGKSDKTANPAGGTSD